MSLKEREKLISWYEKVLSYACMKPNDDGSVFAQLSSISKAIPVRVGQRQIKLPYPSVLKNFDQDETVLFHPLTENTELGESDILKQYSKAINVAMNARIFQLAGALLHIAESTELQRRLSPEQAELTRSLPDIKAGTAKKVESIVFLRWCKDRPTDGAVNVFLKRGGRLRGKKHSRVGIVRWPMYSELCDIDQALAQGTKLAKAVEGTGFKQADADIMPTLKSLFEFIFPEIADSEAYNSYSDGHQAPFLEALLLTSLRITNRINEVIDTYSDFIDNADEMRFDDSWGHGVKSLDDMAKLAETLPVFVGNDGSLSVREPEPEPVKSAPAANVQYAQPAVQPQVFNGYPGGMMQPQVQTQPQGQQAGSDGKVAWGQLRPAQQMPAMPAQMVMVGPNGMPQYVQPAQMMAQQQPGSALMSGYLAGKAQQQPVGMQPGMMQPGMMQPGMVYQQPMGMMAGMQPQMQPVMMQQQPAPQPFLAQDGHWYVQGPQGMVRVQ